MTAITTRIHTWFHGRLVGEDQFGNRYYTEKKAPVPDNRRKARRWVLFNGKAEPSKVPAEWHGWLHYTLDQPIPLDKNNYAWRKPHLPNLTGTPNAYVPPGHLLRGGQRSASTSDYVAWTPE